MIEVLKQIVNQRIAKRWGPEIRRKGFATIDIAKEFADIYAENMLVIAFGEVDLIERRFEFDFMTNKEQGKFETR